MASALSPETPGIQRSNEAAKVWMKEAKDLFGRKTVRELLTTTTNLILPKLVDARASIKFQTLIQGEEIARVKDLPEGTGKTFDIQRIAPNTAYATFSEGVAVTPEDPTLGNPQGTIQQLGKATKISSLLQRTSAVDFINDVGALHASIVQGAINDKLWTELKAVTSNVVTTAEAAATEGLITMLVLRNAKRAVEIDKWPAGDFIVSGPSKFYQFFMDGLGTSQVQYSSSLLDFFRSGGITTLFGMRWLVDTVFGDPVAGTAGEDYAAVGVTGTSVAWGQIGPKIRSEVWREGLTLSDHLISYVEGGAKIVEDDSVALISHA